MEAVVGAGVVKDGVLHRAEELVDVIGRDAQHPLRRGVEGRFGHLLRAVLLPAARQNDPGAGAQPDGPAQRLQLLQTEPKVRGEADDPGGEGGGGQPLQSVSCPVQVGDVGRPPPLEGVGAAQGRREKSQAVHGAGHPGVVVPVGLIAQHHAVGGHAGDEPVPRPQPQHHGDLRQETPPVEADAAECSAGARGSDPHGHPSLRHGKKGLPLEKQGGQNGDPGQILRGAEAFGVKVQTPADGGVAGAVGDVIGAVVRRRPEKEGVGGGEVVGLSLIHI